MNVDCRHWDGLEGMRTNGGGCKAGLDPRVVTAGEKAGWLNRCPCLGKNHSMVICSSREEFTAQELEQKKLDREELFKMMRRTVEMLSAIKSKCAPGQSGKQECPECKGVMHYGRSPHNGHVHIQCETKNCIYVME